MGTARAEVRQLRLVMSQTGKWNLYMQLVSYTALSCAERYVHL